MEKYQKKIILIYAIIVIALGNLFYWFWIYPIIHMAGGYGTTVYDKIENPSHTYSAILFEGNSGATTGFATRISIISTNSNFNKNDKGNIFIADNNHDDAPPGKTGGSPVKIFWLNDTMVRIEYHPRARIFKKETSLKSVKIDYIENADLK